MIDKKQKAEKIFQHNCWFNDNFAVANPPVLFAFVTNTCNIFQEMYNRGYEFHVRIEGTLYFKRIKK
jgi:hypothetical protein